MKQKTFFIASLLATASFTFSIAHEAKCQWVEASEPTGNSFSLAVIGNDLFVGTYGNGVYRSGDNGASWTPVNNGLTKQDVNNLAVSGTKLFAATDSGAFQSTDEGANWSAIGLVDSFVAPIFAIGTNLFAETLSPDFSSYDGPYVSTDFGKTWAGGNGYDAGAESMAALGSIIFDGTLYDGMYFSTDNGANWAPIGAGLGTGSIFSIVPSGSKLFAAVGNEVDCSTDSGWTWTDVTNNLNVGDIFQLVSNGGYLFVATDHGVFFSTDDGARWTDSNLPVSIRQLAVLGSELVAVTSYDSIWRRPLSEFDTIRSAPTIGYWTTASTDGFTHRTYPASGFVGGKIYVMGGYPSVSTPGALNTCEVFDPVSNSWSTPMTSGTFSARGGAASSVVNGKIYVMGGADNNWNETNTLEVLDSSSNTWTTPTTNGTFTPRLRLVSAVVKGKIYAIGGSDKNGYLNTLEVFDPSTNSWSTPITTGTFTARRSSAVAVVDDKIFVIDGFNGQILRTVEVFDPATNVWSNPTTTGTSTARYGCVAGVINGKIYVIGGTDGSRFPMTIDVLDPATNAWSTITGAGTFTGRSGAATALVDGKIYLIGGSIGDPIFGVNEFFSLSGSSVTVNTASTNLELYPNPTGGRVTVHGLSAGKYQVAVANILGENVLEQAENGLTDFTLDLSKLTAGAYFIKVSGSGTTSSRMIVKK